MCERLIVGIDPGVETGLAVVSAATGDAIAVESAPPLATVRRIEALTAEGVLDVRPDEDARCLPIYARHRGATGGERDRIARSVGRVDSLTDVYLDVLATFDAAAAPGRAA